MSRKSDSRQRPREVSYANVKALEAHINSRGSVLCGDAQQRTRAQFIGEVKSLRSVPRGQSRWFEVVISDGTGKINGWFFGRKSISGIQPGSIILFEGLVQMDDGEMTIANPYYEIL